MQESGETITDHAEQAGGRSDPDVDDHAFAIDDEHRGDSPGFEGSGDQAIGVEVAPFERREPLGESSDPFRVRARCNGNHRQLVGVPASKLDHRTETRLGELAARYPEDQDPWATIKQRTEGGARAIHGPERPLGQFRSRWQPLRSLASSGIGARETEDGDGTALDVVGLELRGLVPRLGTGTGGTLVKGRPPGRALGNLPTPRFVGVGIRPAQEVNHRIEPHHVRAPGQVPRPGDPGRVLVSHEARRSLGGDPGPGPPFVHDQYVAGHPTHLLGAGEPDDPGFDLQLQQVLERLAGEQGEEDLHGQVGGGAGKAAIPERIESGRHRGDHVRPAHHGILEELGTVAHQLAGGEGTDIVEGEDLEVPGPEGTG